MVRVIVVGLVMWSASLLPSPATAQPGAPPIRDRNRSFSSYGSSWKDLRDQSVVKQQRDYSCGAAALATVMRYYWGDDVSEYQVLRVIEANLTQDQLADRFQRGLSISDLRLAAVKLQYQGTIGRISVPELYSVRIPVVVALRLDDYDHFVVVRGIVDDWVYLADPSRGNVRMPVGQFAERWIENALLVVAKPGHVSSPWSTLGVRVDEVNRGWLNSQVLRTAPTRTFELPRNSFP